MEKNNNSQQTVFHKSKLVLFTSQIVLIFVVVITCLINLSLENSNQNMWMIVLTSCLGYILPNPKLKMINGNYNGNENKKSINGVSNF